MLNICYGLQAQQATNAFASQKVQPRPSKGQISLSSQFLEFDIIAFLACLLSMQQVPCKLHFYSVSFQFDYQIVMCMYYIWLAWLFCAKIVYDKQETG